MSDPHNEPRALQPMLEAALADFPVVVLTGARQTGKSTLAQQSPIGDARTYASLDESDVLEQAQRTPEALLQRGDRLTLDEVQRAPGLLRTIKAAVDKRRTPGRFLLTGSANLLLMRRVSETLAGRAAYLTLWPMTRGEVAGEGSAGAWSRLLDSAPESWPKRLDATDRPKQDWRAAALRGGYPTPALHLRDVGARTLWFQGYVRTYLERDLLALAQVTSIVDFRRLMQACSLRVGQLLNQTELGRDIALPQPTVHRWLNLLEASYQLVRLPAFAHNRTKRLIKTSKLYWCDTGLALHLAGNDEPEGAHLENLVLQDLLAWQGTQRDETALCYWRTASGAEVDLVLEHKRRLLPIEIKATAKPRVADAEHLSVFLAEYGTAARAGLLMHTGDATFWLTERVLAVPWWRVL